MQNIQDKYKRFRHYCYLLIIKLSKAHFSHLTRFTSSNLDSLIKNRSSSTYDYPILKILSYHRRYVFPSFSLSFIFLLNVTINKKFKVLKTHVDSTECNSTFITDWTKNVLSSVANLILKRRGFSQCRVSVLHQHSFPLLRTVWYINILLFAAFY